MRRGLWHFGLAVIGVVCANGALAGEQSGAPAPTQVPAAEGDAGTATPELMQRLEHLAAARFHSGDLSEAAAARRRVLHLTLSADGRDSIAAAKAMSALARIEIGQQHYLDAEPLLIIARNILDDRGETDPVLLVSVLDGLSRLAQARGDNVRAERLARQAVELGGAVPAGASLRSLGAALAGEDRLAEAGRVLEEALARDRAKAGEDGLATARSYSQLGNLYLRQRRFAEALPLLEQAARIDQERLGATHPFIADDFYDLGLAYEGLKRSRDAERVFLVVLHLLQRGNNLRTPRAAYAQIELARIFRLVGDDDDARTAEHNARDILHAAAEGERKRERQT